MRATPAATRSSTVRKVIDRRKVTQPRNVALMPHLDQSKGFFAGSPLKLEEILPGGWKVIAVLSTHRQRPVISELYVASDDPPWEPLGGIKTRTLRQISIPRLYADAVREIERLRREGPGMAAEMYGFDYELSPSPFRRPGRAGNDDLHYAQWAKRYLDVVADGSSRPIVELAEHPAARGSKSPRSFVRDTLEEARRRDLLIRPGRGRSGGVLTPRAIALLEADKQPTNPKGGR